MKRLIVLVVCSAVVVGVSMGVAMLIGYFTAGANYGALSPRLVASPTAYTKEEQITSISEVPVFPGAVKTEEQCRSDQPDRCYYRLSARASLHDVATFYTATLTGRGWTVTTLNLGSTTENIDFVTVTPTTDNLPVRRLLNVYLVEDADITIVDVRFERWPDPTQISLPPDTEGVSVSWDNSSSDVKLVLNYTTARSPYSILAFHRQTMSDQGWQPGVAVDERDKSGQLIPAFRYSRRGARGPYMGSYVRLYITPLENGRVAVRLVSQGQDVTQAYAAVPK